MNIALLENPHVSRSHRSRAGPAAHGRCAIERSAARLSSTVGFPFEDHHHRLACGDRISPDAEHLIAQGERDAGMTAEAVQSAMNSGGATSGSRAEAQWACHRVEPDFSCASRLAWDRSRRPAAAPVRSPRWPSTSSTHSSCRARAAGGQRGDKPMGLYQRKIAKQHSKVRPKAELSPRAAA